MKPSEWIGERASELNVQDMTRLDGALPEGNIVANMHRAMKEFLNLMYGDIDTPEKPLIAIGTMLIRPASEEAVCGTKVPGLAGGQEYCDEPAPYELVKREQADTWSTVYRCHRHKDRWDMEES